MTITRTRRSRLGWVVAVTVLYTLVGVPLTAWLGPGMGPLSALPVAIAAALLGWRGGLTLAVLCVPINTLFLNLAGIPGWDAMFRRGGATGLVALLAVGLVVGWMRDLIARLHGAEVTLRAREAQLRAQYDGFPIPTLTWQRRGDDFVLVDHNNTAATFTGGVVATLLGVGCREHNRDHPEVVADFERCYAERGTLYREYPSRVATTGEQQYLAVTYVYAPPDLVMAHTEDISARQRAAEALHQSAESFASLFEAAAEGIAITESGRVVAANQALAALLGYAPEEVIGRSPDEFVAPEDRDRVVEFLRSGEERAYEAAYLRRDGTRVTLEIVGRAIRHQGRPARLATIRDITARKQAEADLREVLARAPCLLWRAEIAARPGAGPPGAPALFSWRLHIADESAAQRVLPLDIPPGLTYSDTWNASRHPDDFARCNATSAGALLAGAPSYRQEFRCRDRHGAERWFTEEVALEARAPGRWHAIGICVDITERARAEATLGAAERRSRELYAEAQRQARELALLDRVRTALARELDPAAIHQAIVEAIAGVFGHTSVSLYLLEGDELVLQQIIGKSSDRFKHISVARGIMGRVARTGQPVLLEDVDSDPEFIRTADGIVSEVCVPLFDEGRAVGVLNAESCDGVRLGADDLRLLTAIGQHTSTALARARLYAAAERQARELELLDRVRTALARELDPAAVMRAIVEAIASNFGHTRVSLYLLEGDELVRQQVAGRPSRFVRLPVARGIIGRVARTGQPVLLKDVDSDPEFIRTADGIVSEVCVPLFDEGRAVGVLNLESTDGARLGKPDLRLMIALSEQVGIAIGRARLYAEARANAEQLAAAQAIAHLGSWEHDLARGERRWSDEAFRIAGHPPQAFVPTLEHNVQLVHPDDRERVERAHWAALDGTAPFDLDHRIVRPDGEVRVVHQQVEIVRDAGGRPVKRVATIQDVTERRALEARLAHQAFHDPLTALPNRALFLDRLESAVARAARRGGTVAVLLLDLDRFKVVNDSLGHAAGDHLLIAVAARLRACLRQEDTVARLGGDEFTVLLEEVADAHAAAHAAERLTSALAAPFDLDGHEVYANASIGVVLSTAARDRPAELLRDADVALYRAKARGKGRYELFDAAMSAHALERLELEADLRRGLERGEFVVHYQPKIAVQTGRIEGVEALVRWQHPARGLVAPAAFIPVAEETGLIRPLGRWVLEQACQQARAWQERYPADPPLVMSVNLAAPQFQQPDLAQEIARVLAATGLAPALLQLEITEGVLMDDAPATLATLRRLKELGVRLAIDDFGTGYSSLSYLKRFPVDTLKIDKSFVDGLGTDAEDTAIVQAVLSLALALGLQVVAEGVETAEQAAQLQASSCALAQGYYFAKPLPAAALAALLERDAPLGARDLLPPVACPAPNTVELRAWQAARLGGRPRPPRAG